MSHSYAVDLMLAEGDVIASDLTLLEEMQGYDNSASQLATESIAKRWSIRKLKTEGNSTVEEMWNVFLEWMESLTYIFQDLVNSAVGYGKRMLRRQRFLEDRHVTFQEKVTRPATGFMDAGEYSRRMIVSDTFDPRSCDEIAKTLPGDVKKLMTWAQDGIKQATQVLKIVQTDNSRFDTVEDINFNKAGVSHATNFNILIGKKLSRQFNQVGSSRDSDEQQLLWGLPGNAYLQFFSYHYDGKASGDKYPMEGVRFISPIYDTIPPRELDHPKDEILRFNKLYELIRSVKPLALALVEIETNNRGIQREMRTLRKAVESTRKNKRSTTVEERYAHRVARERLMTANHSLRAVLHTLRTLTSGMIARYEAQKELHLKSN